MSNQNSAAPGWYDSGEGNGRLRWWDGSQWTQHFHPPLSSQVDAQQSASTPNAERGVDSRPSAEQNAHVVNSLAAREKPTLFSGKRVAEGLQVENDELRTRIARFQIDDVAERHAAVDSLDEQIVDLRRRLEEDTADRERQIADLETRIAEARSELIEVQQRIDVQDVGLFDFQHPASSSAELADDLSRLRAEIKAMNKPGEAVSSMTGFTFNGSKAEGTKMVKDYCKLMLRAYNAEAENCIKTVRAGNLATAQARLQRAVDQIAKTGSMLSIQVTSKYHRLRLRELELAARHLQRVQDERELERERKAELREQRKAEAELRAEQERLTKEKNHYLNSIAALEAKGDLEAVTRMRDELADVERAISDVDYRAANIRAGYVYVISNLGAFGDSTVKIGMTRRLEPMDRVKELGDASVPYVFDVHALFFSKDAVGVEAMLHKTFAEQRVNKVNLRREFFHVRPDQVLDALRESNVEVLEFDPHQAAEEFRTSWPTVSPDTPSTL